MCLNEKLGVLTGCILYFIFQSPGKVIDVYPGTISHTPEPWECICIENCHFIGVIESQKGKVMRNLELTVSYQALDNSLY